jgi:Winged helix DNA-binding domain
VTADELRERRARRQRLHRPPGGPVDVVRQLLAVQAQDLPAARLAVRARGRRFAAGDVDAALASGELVIAWLMRGTLHLVAREDHGWLLALTAPTRVTANRRRLGQEGVPPDEADRAVELIAAAVAADGPQIRRELAERLDAAGIRTAGQATPHLLMLAALRGRIVLAGAAFTAAPPPGPPPGDARAELARRWLAAHGPASERDLAGWSGLALRDVRAGLETIAAELRDHGDGLVDLAAAPRSRARLAPALLGAFDPYLLGWRDRGFAVAPEHARRVHPGGGILRAVAVDDGRVVATWRRGRRGIELEPFAPLDPVAATALEAEAADIARFESG